MSIELRPDIFQAFQKSVPSRPFDPSYPFEWHVTREIASRNLVPSGMTPQDRFDVGFQIGKSMIANMGDWCNVVPGAEDIYTASIPSSDYYRSTQPIIDRAQEALGQCVDELSIPPEAKRFIRANVDNTEFCLDAPYKFGHCAHYDSDEGVIKVNLNVYDFWDHAWEITQIFYRQEPLSQFSHALVYRSVGHEVGHGLAQAVSDKLGFEFNIPTLYGNGDMQDFPIIWDSSSEEDGKIVSAIHAWAMEERFAEYFGQELVRGAGFSGAIMHDFMGQLLRVPFGTGFTVGQVREIIEGVSEGINEQLSANEETQDPKVIEQMQFVVKRMFRMLYMNQGYIIAYPFTRKTVEHIINDAWRDGMANAPTSS